jgi:hypothetical protein
MSNSTFETIIDYAFLIFMGLSTLVPVLQFVARQTASKTDDEYVEKFATFVHDALSYFPIARRGRTLGQKDLIDAVPTSKTEKQP